MKRLAWAAGALAILALALILRLEALEARPMHADEAVHGLKLRDFQEGTYRYDPSEFHGPTLYQLAHGLLALQGALPFEEWTEAQLRLGPALAGAVLPLLALLLAGLIGREASIWAALLAALSSGLVYYSRSFIQESLFVLLSGALLVTALHHAQRPRLALALGAGLFAGAALATKETAVLSFLALGLAWGLCRPGRALPAGFRRPLHPHFLGLGALGALCACVGLLSSGLSDPGAVGRLLTAASAYASRGVGAEGAHIHPWSFYLEILAGRPLGAPPRLTELPLLALAAVGLFAAWRRGVKRMLALYTVALLGIYSALPYKTPWCLTGFLHGFTLLGGSGAALLIRLAPRAWLAWLGRLALCALLALIGLQARQAAGAHGADPRNPYVYAQTVPDTVRLARRVAELARLHPEGEALRIHVMAPDHDYWPLPWYLRRHARVGWWPEEPDTPDAPLLIVAAPLGEALAEILRGDYHVSLFGLRPGVLLELHVERSLWDAFIETVGAGPSPPEQDSSEPMEPPFKAHHAAMGSPFEIRIANVEPGEAKRAAAAAFALLDRLEGELSRFRSGNDLARIAAHGPGARLPIGLHTLELIMLSKRVHELTGGLFDPTIGALTGLAARARDPCALARARAAIGLEKLFFHGEPPAVEVAVPGLTLDFGGVAKGYAIDRMLDLLAEWGIQDALVSAGGSSVAARGNGPDGWRVRLADPSERSLSLGTVRLQGLALGASGIETRPGQILDPRSGKPTQRYRAAFVLARCAAEADAFSTALMLLAPEDVATLGRARPDLAFLLVPQDPDARPLWFGDWGAAAGG